MIAYCYDYRLLVGALVTIGFLAFFALVGLPVSYGVGAILLFGVSYGPASLGCPLPLFLTLVGASSAAAASSPPSSPTAPMFGISSSFASGHPRIKKTHKEAPERRRRGAPVQTLAATAASPSARRPGTQTCSSVNQARPNSTPTRRGGTARDRVREARAAYVGNVRTSGVSATQRRIGSHKLARRVSTDCDVLIGVGSPQTGEQVRAARGEAAVRFTETIE